MTTGRINQIVHISPPHEDEAPRLWRTHVDRPEPQGLFAPTFRIGITGKRYAVGRQSCMGIIG